MSKASQKAKAGRLISIDVLRGIAVLMVLGRHLPYSTTLGGGPQVDALPGWAMALSHYGEYGVHLFLVISGFCIHMRWARHADVTRKIDFVSFWKRRLTRLYPPYFLTILLSLAGLFALASLRGGGGGFFAARFGYPSNTQLIIDLVFLLLLLQNLNGAHARIGNGPFWSLALEEQLYMLYFPLLWLRRNKGWTAALVIAFLVTLGWRAFGLFVLETPPRFWMIVGPALWFSWVLGAVAVEADRGYYRLPGWAYSPLVGFAFLLLALLLDAPKGLGFELPKHQLFDELLFCGAFFVLINICCRMEREGRLPLNRMTLALEKVGLWSYSIYLTHIPIMVATKQLALRLNLDVPGVLSLRLIASLVGGYIFYRAVEVPFINRSRKQPTTTKLAYST